MKLRSRLALAALAVSAPLLVALVWWDAAAQRHAAESALIGFTTPYLEQTGWRQRCAANPELWGPEGTPTAFDPDSYRSDGPPFPRRRVAGPPPVRAFGARPRPRPGDPPRHSRPAQFFAYDETLSSQNPSAPVLDAATRRDATTQDITLLSAPWRSGDVEVLLRVPGGSGPCTYLFARGTTEPWLGAILPPTHIWLTPLLVVFGAVLIAMGPVLRRIQRLTAAVRRSALSQYAEGVNVAGNDEVGELARAFDAAARDVRLQLAERDRRERALREFLANTTHDVMIPLTVLQGHLSEIKSALGDGQAIDVTALTASMDEAHYIGALIGNLSLAAKLDSNTPELQRLALDLNALATRVVARHRPIARQLEVAVELALPEAPVHAEADLTMLEQALSNIVYNAIRHNRAGGHVAVILERAAVAGAHAFHLRVIDDGPGIPEAELARLVERGFRGNQARTRDPHGQGLGLHITQQVVALHGFSLSFQASEYGGLQVDLRGPCAAQVNVSLVSGL